MLVIRASARPLDIRSTQSATTTVVVVVVVVVVGVDDDNHDDAIEAAVAATTAACGPIVCLRQWSRSSKGSRVGRIDTKAPPCSRVTIVLQCYNVAIQ